jgi:hypothetical protein
MIVGTLSTARRKTPAGDRQTLNGSARRKCIADAAHRFSPDLLVCAGDSLISYGDVVALSRDDQLRNLRTIILVEVSNESKGGKSIEKKGRKVPRKTGGFRSRIFILRRGKIKPLGGQMFGESSEVMGAGPAALDLRKRFENELTNRLFKVKGKSAVVLCCGEINILRGRNTVRCESETCEHILDAADIVLNPTHDRMGNAGTLRAKRKFLSRKIGGRKRLYVSSSNWNTAKRQKQTAPTLHDYFFAADQLQIGTQIAVHSYPDYEYRQAAIEF